nr:MAG TPA: hypothetical protein [Caudoviricetes sp.]
MIASSLLISSSYSRSDISKLLKQLVDFVERTKTFRPILLESVLTDVFFVDCIGDQLFHCFFHGSEAVPSATKSRVKTNRLLGGLNFAGARNNEEVALRGLQHMNYEVTERGMNVVTTICFDILSGHNVLLWTRKKKAINTHANAYSFVPSLEGKGCDVYAGCFLTKRTGSAGALCAGET